MLKYFLAIVFIVRVSMPMGIKQTYEAKTIRAGEMYYYIILTDDRVIYAPIMFTVIEEKK